MGGFFAVASKESCIMDLFFGTDYHSHLGTKRGGMAVYGDKGFDRAIHNIENSPFRTKFDKDVNEMIVSFEAIAGSSGSALFDGHGQLVGMMRGYTTYPGYTETVAVPLSEILSYFEIVFKYKIHYQ